MTFSPFTWGMVNANWTARKIKTRLARSKAVKLHVWMDKALKDRDPTIIPRLISTKVPRVSSLRIMISAALTDDWREVPGHDAPVIEVFSLYITYLRRQDYGCRLNLTSPTSYSHSRSPPNY